MVFHTLVNEGTMARAGERLFITQPAISAHVKALEGGLGVSLFDRVGRRSVVNQAGLVLYGKTEQIFSAMDELKAAMEDLRGVRTGRLYLGVSGVWVYHLDGVLNAFNSLYPHVEVRVQMGSSDLIERLVLERSVDLGFIGRPTQRPELGNEHLVTDEVVPVCRAGHPLAQGTHVDAASLRGAAFVAREVGSATRAASDELMAALGIGVRASLQLGSQEAIKQVVMGGDGIGLVCRAGVTREIAAEMLAVPHIDPRGAPLRLHLVYHQGKTRTMTQTSFLKLVHAQFPKDDGHDETHAMA
jgi:DNA-binding transcriptional LysR family regulator